MKHRATLFFSFLLCIFVVQTGMCHKKLLEVGLCQAGYQPGQAAYVVCKPQKYEGSYSKRGNTLLIITFWKDGTDTVHLEQGYGLKANKPVKLTFLDKHRKSTKTMDFIGHGEDAWASAGADQAAIAALKSASYLTVEGESTRGTKTKDTYALSGSGKAIEAAFSHRNKEMLPPKATPPAAKKTEAVPSKEAPQPAQIPQAPAAPAPATDAPEQTTAGNGARWVLKPQKSEGNYTKRGPVAFIISFGHNVIYLDQGYPLPLGKEVMAVFFDTQGNTLGKVPFKGREEQAHADPKYHAQLLNLAKRASTLVVEGTSARGTKTKDTYRLSGSAKALAQGKFQTKAQIDNKLKKHVASPKKPASKTAPPPKHAPSNKPSPPKAASKPAPAKKTAPPPKNGTSPKSPAPKKQAGPVVETRRAPV